MQQGDFDALGSRFDAECDHRFGAGNYTRAGVAANAGAVDRSSAPAASATKQARNMRVIASTVPAPREATVLAMREVTAPIVAISLVLMAVFLPVAFVPGTSGQLYQQFALTIAISVAISTFNALTLSPALCAILLRAEHGPKRAFFRAFDAGFKRFVGWYERVGALSVEHWVYVMGVFAFLIAATVFLYGKLPTAFLPEEDQGYFIVSVTLPDGASLPRTELVTRDVVEKMLAIPGVASAQRLTGRRSSAEPINRRQSSMFIRPAPRSWPTRRSPSPGPSRSFATPARSRRGRAAAGCQEDRGPRRAPTRRTIASRCAIR
jgi:multidrug efflux pump subunit AcrB